jgi:large subunit ribosomal protein L22
MATEAKAILRFIRVAPRKARLVVDLIRGRQVSEAFNILKFTPRSASRVVEKVLKSAVANAENLEIGDPDVLWITRVYVDGGPVLKRFNARSMGRANPIKKRTSHITVVVAPKVGGETKSAAGSPGGRKPSLTK